MSSNILQTSPEWRDRIVHSLRKRNATGSEIGAVLAEVEAHVNESGETAAAAFGDPDDYAKSRIAQRTRSWSQSIVRALIVPMAVLSLLLIAGASWALGTLDWRWGPSRTPVALAAGIGLAAITVALMQRDAVRDPQTHDLLLKRDATRIGRAAAAAAVIVVLAASASLVG